MEYDSVENKVILHTSRLILEPIGIDHATENYVSWLNDPEVYAYLDTNGGYTLENLRSYINDTIVNKTLFWAIIIKDLNKHIGNIKIDPINTRHNYAEYGIMLGDKTEWGKGYAKEASLAVIKHCFEKIKIRKINLGVVEDNTDAVNLYKNIGFKIEGKLIKHGYYLGKYTNILRMAMFNPSYDTN